MKRALSALAVVATLALVFAPLAAALATWGFESRVLHLDKDALHALGTHVALAACAALVAAALGVPFAIYVGGTRSPLRRFFIALGAFTLAVPQYLAAEALIDLAGPAGRLTRALAGASAGDAAQAQIGVYRFAGWVYTVPAAGLVVGACLFPLVALAVASADRRLDARLREAARLARGRLGAARVTARALLAPALGSALLVFALALTEFAVPQTLRVRTIGEDVFVRLENGDRAGAAALGALLVGLALVAGALGALLLARRRVASDAALEGDVPRFTLRPPRPLLATLMGIVAIAPGLLAPLASLALQARAERFVLALSTAWGTWGGDALRAVGGAALGATIALLLAAVVGRALRRATRANALVVGAIGCGLAVPAPLVGLGLVALWNRPATAFVYDGTAVVVLGWLARFLPVSVLLARAAFARVPVELEDAAALMGHGGAARARKVVLPLAAPGLVAAWLAFYVLAATEYAATYLLAAPGKPLLAPTVVNEVHYGQSATIAAAGLILVGAISLPLLPLSLSIVGLRSAFLGARRTWRSS